MTLLSHHPIDLDLALTLILGASSLFQNLKLQVNHAGKKDYYEQSD
jgi:hypothetical protein